MPLLKDRPRVRLLLAREVCPGEPTEAVVVLEQRRPLAVAGVSIAIEGVERIYETASASDRTSRMLCHLRAEVLGAAELPAGRSEYRVLFTVPRELPPSYAGRRVVVTYLATVHVVIPWWLDRRARFEVHVGLGDWHPSPASAPVVFSTRPEGPRAREPHMEVSLSDRTVAQGGVLVGAVALSNTAYNRYTDVEVAVCASEQVAGMDAEVLRYRIALPLTAPSEAQQVPFRVRLPAGIPPSHESRHWALRWQVVVTAGIRWRADLAIKVPIWLVPRHRARPPSPRHGAPPSVGNLRVQAMWTEVASAHGLALDGGVIRGRPAGVDLTVRREHRGRGGLHLVAELRYPSLHLDLSIQPGSFGLGRRGEPGTVRWNRRHVARSRFPEQLQAFGAHIAAPLGAFADIVVTDDYARVARRGGGASRDRLEVFVAAARELAERIATGRDLVPPPRVMAAHMAQWSRLAENLDGELDRARVAVTARILGMAAEIRTEWSRAGAPHRTVIELTSVAPIPVQPVTVRAELDRPIPLADAEAAVPPSARPLLARVARGARALQLGPDAVALSLPAPIEDPAPLAGRARSVAELVRALTGPAAPYR